VKISNKYRYQEQFPNRGNWDVLHPSYLTIGGSGVVGTFGSQSPMSNGDEGASMNSGAGKAAGAGITGAGSGAAYG
jgi:hypothetical protein